MSLDLQAYFSKHTSLDKQNVISMLCAVVLTDGSNCIRGNFVGINSAWGKSPCGNFP